MRDEEADVVFAAGAEAGALIGVDAGKFRVLAVVFPCLNLPFPCFCH
jgi:hypothetical protein